MNRKVFDYFFWGLLAVAFVAGPLRYSIPYFAGGSLLLCWLYLMIQIKKVIGRLIYYPMLFCLSCLALALIKNDFDGVGILWQTALIPVIAVGYLVLLLQRGDYNLFRNCLLLALFVLLPFAIVTLLAESGASRTLSGNANTLNQMAVAYENRIKGVFDYGAIHALPFIIAGIYVAYRKQRNVIIKITFGMFLLLFIAVVIKSVFFAAFVLTCSLLYLVRGEILNIKIRCVIFLVSVVSIWLLWSSGAITYVIDSAVSNIFGAETNNIATIKAKQISDYYHYGAGFEGRMNRYEAALNGFLNNIFIGGINVNEEAGHSFLLQILGDSGLIGFLIYLCYFVSMFRLVFKVLPKRLHWYYGIVIGGFVFLGLIKNISINFEALAVFGWAPMFFLLREDDFYLAVNNARHRL